MNWNRTEGSEHKRNVRSLKDLVFIPVVVAVSSFKGSEKSMVHLPELLWS
jgi:hypothetical protein